MRQIGDEERWQQRFAVRQIDGDGDANKYEVEARAGAICGKYTGCFCKEQLNFAMTVIRRAEIGESVDWRLQMKAADANGSLNRAR
ncbi:hypothetical protein Q3G72_017382 [Acer saccharum]|nr:hypothetical protein Q3G72_017382 [Acer saccharum]